jgi:hypothetical protein
MYQVGCIVCWGIFHACFFTLVCDFLNLGWLVVHHISTCNEKVAAIFRLLRRLRELFFVADLEAHLLVVWWCEYILLLGFFGQLTREDFTLDVCAGSDVTDWQCDAFAHNFGIQIVAFDFFSRVPRNKFDRVRVRQVLLHGKAFLQIASFIDNVRVVNNDCGQVFPELQFKCLIGLVLDGSLSEGVASDVDKVDAPSLR